MIKNIETIFINYNKLVFTQNRSTFKIEIEKSTDDLNKYSHCFISQLSLSNQVFDSETDFIYLHCSAVNNKFPSIIGNNIKSTDIICSLQVSNNFTQFYETYDIMSNMKPYNGKNVIEFHFTDDENRPIIVDNYCEFSFNFVETYDFDRVINKIEIFFDLMAQEFSK